MTCDTVAIFTTCLTRTHACFSKITEFETKKKLKPRYGVLHFDFRGNAYSDPLQLFLTSKNGEYPLGEKKKETSTRSLEDLPSLIFFENQRFHLPTRISSKHRHQRAFLPFSPLLCKFT